MKRRQALRERTLSRNSQAPKQGFYFGAGEAITGINNDRGFSSSLMPGKAPMPWKTPGGLGGRAPQSQNHLPFPKKRIFRLANRKLVESQALSPRSQLQDVTKTFRWHACRRPLFATPGTLLCRLRFCRLPRRGWLRSLVGKRLGNRYVRLLSQRFSAS